MWRRGRLSHSAWLSLLYRLQLSAATIFKLRSSNETSLSLSFHGRTQKSFHTHSLSPSFADPASLSSRNPRARPRPFFPSTAQPKQLSAGKQGTGLATMSTWVTRLSEGVSLLPSRSALAQDLGETYPGQGSNPGRMSRQSEVGWGQTQDVFPSPRSFLPLWSNQGSPAGLSRSLYK